MKILYLYQYFGTPKGSWSTRVFEFTRHWVKQGHKVCVITAPYEKSDIRGKSFITKLEIEGIKIIVINSGDSNRFSFLKRAYRALLFSLIATFYAIKQSKDVIIASSGPITIGIPGLMAAFFSRKKLVFEIRDLWPDGAIEMGLIKNRFLIRIARYYEHFIMNKSDLIITASSGQKNNLLQRFENHKIEVVNHPVDVSFFQSKMEEDAEFDARFLNKKIFLHIGSLGFIHNCTFIIDAAIELKKMCVNDDIVIVFIGEGSQRQLLEQKAEIMSFNNVFFLGLKPKSKLPFWMKKSVASLFTTLNNPIQDTSSPNKIFDSFAAGRPIIQNTKGWIYNLVEDQGIGINAPTPPAMAKAIFKLAQDEDIAKVMGTKALNYAKTNLDSEILSKRYLDYLD